MADRAACQHILTSYPVIALQLDPFLRGQVTILPTHIVNLGFWTNELLGFAVTGKAPFHLQGILLVDRRHAIDLTVTSRATDSLSNVNTMIKVGVFRQIVDSLPFDRLIVSIAGPNRFKVRTVGPYLRMTIHAGLRRGHARRGGRLDRRVAVSAIYAVITDVMLMAELYGLLFLDVSPGEVRRAGNLRVNVKCRPSKDHPQDHTDPGNIVRTFRKKLCHFLSLFNR